MMAALVAAGAVVGVGLALIIRELVPAPPDLGTALARLNGPSTTRPTQHTTSRPVADVRGRLGARLHQAAELVGLPTPRRDLELLGRSVEALLTAKVALAMVGVALAPAAAALVAAAGTHVPVAIPVAVSIGLAVLLFVLPDIDVKRKAATARREFRRGLCTYVDLVALERLADASAIEALERAANVGGGWVFDRIRDTLLHARLAGTSPWQALGDLAAEVGISELTDISDIVAASGEDGAAVHQTLRARARALRTALLTDHQTAANAASERLAIPVAGLGLLFVVLLTYPAIARILAP